MENAIIIEKKAEETKLKNWLQSSHAERFHKLMRLWKINKMLQNASVKNQI
jgi:hypothetical protein